MWSEKKYIYIYADFAACSKNFSDKWGIIHLSNIHGKVAETLTGSSYPSSLSLLVLSVALHITRGFRV